MMTINDLRDIIMKHGVGYLGMFCIDGCDLLEHVSDMDDFISFLHEFKSFIRDHPDPIEIILNGDVEFRFDNNDGWFWVIALGTYYRRAGLCNDDR
jgi:hypothetical protein